MDEQKYICPHCGQLISNGETPCHNCGKSIEWGDNSASVKQEAVSEEVDENTEKSSKPWKKIIVLFIFCCAIYSYFFAGPGTPQEFFEDQDDASVITTTAIQEYVDDLGEDKLAKNKAGYEFAKLIMNKVASGERNIIEYKNMQFDLDKYPDLAPVNAIGNLALRYDFGRSQRNDIEINLEAPSEFKEEIIKKRNQRQTIACYVPGKLTGTDDFMGAPYHYFFGRAIPDPSEQLLCTFVNNPNNYFSNFGVYYVDGIVLNDKMGIRTPIGFNYEVPRVFVVDESIRGRFEHYDYLITEYPDPYKDPDYLATMRKIRDVFDILYIQYKDKDLEPLTYSGKNMDTAVKSMVISPNTTDVYGDEYNIRYDDNFVEVQTYFGLREDPRWVHIRNNASNVIFTGNIRIGSDRPAFESYLNNQGYYYESEDNSIMVYSPNSDIWQFIFDNDNKVRDVYINREYTWR